MTEFVAGTWYPIETAPKDGTEFDVWRDDRRVTNVWWGSTSLTKGVRKEFGVPDECWCCAFEDGFVDWIRDFTHWTPIPGKPKEV